MVGHYRRACVWYSAGQWSTLDDQNCFTDLNPVPAMEYLAGGNCLAVDLGTVGRTKIRERQLVSVQVET